MALNQLEIRGIDDPYRSAADKGWDIIDGSRLTEDLVLDVDVAIVGSGAGGGIAAETLAAAGLKVCILEEGPLKSSDQFNMVEREGFTDLYQEGGIRRTTDGSVLLVQGRNVGGGTTINWCSTFRTPDQTLAYWRDRYGLKGCEPADMAPYFESMERRLNVSEWLAPPNRNNAILQEGAEALGYSWGVIPRNVAGCWNLGYCGVGCPVDAKKSMLVTTVPAALDNGAVLVHHARVSRVNHNAGCVEGVEAHGLKADRSGRTSAITVRARHTVLSGGAVNTPAVLMRSNVPDPYRRIGRRTFLHPVTVSLAQFDEAVEPYYGAPQSIYSDQFTWAQGVDGPMGYKLEVIPLLPGTFAAILGGHGSAMQAAMNRLPNTHGMMSFLRDGFHEESPGGVVSLAEDGSPLLDYPITPYMQDGIRRSLLSMMEIQFAAGAKAVKASHADAGWHRTPGAAREQIDGLVNTPGKIGLTSAHAMGGCAMGEIERESVVDSHGRFRFLDGLSIYDGSIFPTGLGANPQMSIFGFVNKFSQQLGRELS